ncbi:hypothetical protein VKI22_01590 [Cyanobacterium aponinum UTEX 3221]|uniref:hypothetical protein n=1 Tax=Cyanobacterium aponinum TaxID=379064 RepID=UPI002B4BE056|nr:hypothetical protein [Cyanobacterium aponinum]WRL38816.1 hypothetical protein VKI22_01590 [Cyanobacterium aponinum UTEX 3221]
MNNDMEKLLEELALKEALLDSLAILATTEALLELPTGFIAEDLLAGRNLENVRKRLLMCSLALFNYIAFHENHYKNFLASYPVAQQEVRKKWEDDK